MVGVFEDYFANLFISSNLSDMSLVLSLQNYRLTDEMKIELDREFTAEEVKPALDQSLANKSPGPNDLTTTFYKKLWDIIGHKVTASLLNLLNDVLHVNAINMIDISLILKKKRPEFSLDLRPINLCNVVYKLFSKVLVNRLKPVMFVLISDTQ